MPTEDLEIVDKLLERDDESWEMINRDYVPYFNALARQVVDSESDAAECVQQSMAKLWENDAKILRDFRGISTLKTYLARIIHRDCLDFIRSEKRQRRKVERKTDANKLVSGIDEEDPLLNRMDIESLVAQLSSKNRLLVKLIYYDGLAHEEVAKVFNTSTSTVDVWHFRMKKRLRDLAGVGKSGEGLLEKGEM